MRPSCDRTERLAVNRNHWHDGGRLIAMSMVGWLVGGAAWVAALMLRPPAWSPDALRKAGDRSAASGAVVELDGAALYARHCQSCHRPDGRGVHAVFPPLDGNIRAQGDPRIAILAVLHGLQGPLIVQGTHYDGVMPEFGSLLEDRQIAGVLTHVRRAWGGHRAAIDADAVRALRLRHTRRQSAWSSLEELTQALDAKDLHAQDPRQ